MKKIFPFVTILFLSSNLLASNYDGEWYGTNPCAYFDQSQDVVLTIKDGKAKVDWGEEFKPNFCSIPQVSLIPFLSLREAPKASLRAGVRQLADAQIRTPKNSRTLGGLPWASASLMHSRSQARFGRSQARAFSKA